MLLITNVDQYIGYSLASYLVGYSWLRPHLRLTCETLGPCSKFLAHSVQTLTMEDSNPDQMARILRRVTAMVLVIGNEPQRVANSERLCRAAIREGVRMIIVLSRLGASMDRDTQDTLYECGAIESMVCRPNAPYAWAVVRLQCLQQEFHLLSPFVEQYHWLGLPVSSLAELYPVDVSDMCSTLASLLFTDTHPPRLATSLEDHAETIIHLLGPSTTPVQIAESMAMATGYRRLGYKAVSSKEFRQYLASLKHNLRLYQQLQNRFQIHDDRWVVMTCWMHSPSIHKAIQALIDYFTNMDKTPPWRESTNVALIYTKRSMDEFITAHANDFKLAV